MHEVSRASGGMCKFDEQVDLVVRATFSHTTVLPEWRAGIKIETHLGHPAFGVDSRHGHHLPTIG